MKRVSRRKFLEVVAKILFGIFSFICFSSFFSRKSYSTIEEGILKEKKLLFDLEELKRKGVIRFEYKNEPALLIFYMEEIKAFDATCPHMGCPVNAYLDKGIFACPCHLSKFDILSGKRLSGPAPHGLKEIKIRIVDSKIYVL